MNFIVGRPASVGGMLSAVIMQEKVYVELILYIYANGIYFLNFFTGLYDQNG